MPTTVSTTALTAAEIQFLDECRTHSKCASFTQQIAQMTARIATLQTARTAAIAEHQTTLATVLSSRVPPVSVPGGATISRVGDNLVVSTP